MNATSKQEVRNESIVVDFGSDDGVLGFSPHGPLSEAYESPICNSANAFLGSEGAENPCTKSAFQRIIKIDYEPRYKFAKYVFKSAEI